MIIIFKYLQININFIPTLNNIKTKNLNNHYIN